MLTYVPHINLYDYNLKHNIHNDHYKHTGHVAIPTVDRRKNIIH